MTGHQTKDYFDPFCDFNHKHLINKPYFFLAQVILGVICHSIYLQRILMFYSFVLKLALGVKTL